VNEEGERDRLWGGLKKKARGPTKKVRDAAAAAKQEVIAANMHQAPVRRPASQPGSRQAGGQAGAVFSPVGRGRRRWQRQYRRRRRRRRRRLGTGSGSSSSSIFCEANALWNEELHSESAMAAIWSRNSLSRGRWQAQEEEKKEESSLAGWLARTSQLVRRQHGCGSVWLLPDCLPACPAARLPGCLLVCLPACLPACLHCTLGE
jgi:hypothetical protein